MKILILGKNWRLVTSFCTNIQYLFYTMGLQDVKPLQLWDMIPGKTGKVNKARGFYGQNITFFCYIMLKMTI